MFDAIAFAGGGNRCYWQGGFVEAAGVMERPPRLVVGASAGAFQAALALTGRGPVARSIVVPGCDARSSNVDWSALGGGGRFFPVADLYRDLILESLGPAFAALKAGPELRVALARPPARLPLALAIPLGIAVYQVEKKIAAPVHPKGGRALGFRPVFASLAGMATVEELTAALMASASVPPFMPVGRVDGAPALDGGLVDNVPVEPLEPIEAAGGRTLVLLTRRYGRVPDVPGRTYVQPGEKIGVGQFDITDGTGIRLAYEQGLRDGEAFARDNRRT